MSNPVLEVIACSVVDAIRAQEGGAGRLEIVRDLHCGGLTPAIELVKTIKNAVELPLRVMLRESVGYGAASLAEITKLCNAAERFAELEVDGLVIGFLQDDEIDIELTARVLGCAPYLKATFHHAFEKAGDRLQALHDIKQLPQVDRILSSGGAGQVNDRIKRLDNDAKAAAPELTILAGGGIDGEALSSLMRSTEIREFHVGRAARWNNRVEEEVKSELVAELVRVMKNSSREGL